MNHIMVPYIDYIGAKLFTDTYKSDVVQALSQSPPINLLIRDIAQELANKDQKSIDFHIKALKLQAAQTVQNMIANVSSTWATRVFGYSVKTMLGRMYHHGVHVRESEIERLRLVATDAAKQGVPLIFLPCHKSHVDYLVVSYILYSVGIALPHIAAGDNLNLPGLGAFLRHGGAFFIRRKWGHDPLYTLIMKEYIIYLMEHGYNIEAFVEGTRSRTGKLLRPKFGVLKICMDAVFSGRVKDAIIIPVSIGYDKVIETPSYVDEMLGRPKEKESLGKLVNSGFNLLQLKWGRIDVRFGEAISMHKFIKDTQPDKASTSVMHPKVLQAMGYHILSSINNISVIMPTGLVGTVLLTLRGRGVGRNELIRKVVTLRNEIVKRGGSVAEVESSAYADVVDRAIKVLGDLVGRRQDTLEPVYYPILRFPLSFYRNQTIHYFVHEAILCVAMYSTIKRGGDIHAQRIPIASRLTEDVAFISRLLKFEFVYQGQGLEKNLQYTVDRLLKGNVVEVGSENDAQWITLSQNERDIGRETYDFYCFLLWPFLETYWLAAVSLYTLLPESADTHVMYWVEEKLFMKRCQVFGKTLYYEGERL